MGINRRSFSSIGTLFVFFQFSFFICFIQLKELRMKMIILTGLLLLSVITVEPKSVQREKAAGNAEQRARQLDQGAATFESRDKNEEEQVRKLQTLQKMLRIRQANSPKECTECTKECTCDGTCTCDVTCTCDRTCTCDLHQQREEAKKTAKLNIDRYPNSRQKCIIWACNCEHACRFY